MNRNRNSVLEYVQVHAQPTWYLLRYSYNKHGFHTVAGTVFLASLYGQESPGWISLFKFVLKSFLKKYPDTSILLVKIIGQLILRLQERWINRFLSQISL